MSDANEGEGAAERGLALQLELQLEVAELARRLIGTRTTQLAAEVELGVRQVATLAGADRTYLALVGRDGAVRSFDWQAEGLVAEGPDTNVGWRERFSYAAGYVMRGEVLHVPRVAELPREATAERERFESRGVQSILTIPVRISGRVVGYQIFECVRQQRSWSDAEIELLRLMAEIFATALSRMHTEDALRESEERFRALAENAIDLIAELGEDGCFLYVSPSFAVTLGWTSEDLLGSNVFDFLAPEEREPNREILEAALGRGLPADTVIRFRHRDGSWRWLQVTGRAFRIASGAQRMALIGHDITERRALEEALRDSQAQLLQAQKMEAVGRLAGGIAHDFNNLLMVIMGNIRWLVDQFDASDPATRALADIQEAGDRAVALTRQLLAFSRPQPDSIRRVDLNTVVNGLANMLRRLLGESIELELALAETGPSVEGDVSRFEQVLVNLTVNARDAMAEGGRLRIVTSERALSHHDATRRGLDAGRRYALLSVVDDGSGISEAALEHIFEPFFTTKEPGKGTGLGLSIVYSVIQERGGNVEIESTPGAGTRVDVYLPLCETPRADVVEPPSDLGAAWRGSETVLLAEDETSVRRLVRRTLEEYGYVVLEAEDGERALEIARAAQKPIHLLVTDVVMPRLGGGPLARQLLADHPELRVIFMSGYPHDRAGGTLPPGGFLQKPFTHEELLTKVRELLGEHATSG